MLAPVSWSRDAKLTADTGAAETAVIEPSRLVSGRQPTPVISQDF